MVHDPQSPRTPRFMVIDKGDSLLSWSLLVEKWIHDPSVWPTTFEELRAQCDRNGVFYDFPEGLTKIVILQKPRDTMTIRLPAMELFDEGQAAIRGGRAGAPERKYELPLFYDKFFVPGSQRQPLDVDTALELHRKRTSEYAINGCA